ncbi:MAG: RibD family protein [Planctomycetota bacterium]
MRIVLADDRPLPRDRKLWLADGEGSVLVATGPGYPEADADDLRGRGVEVLPATPAELLDELGRRRLTNVLVEGGGKLLGRLFDARLVDEVWAFIAPKVFGSAAAPGPVGGLGIEALADAAKLDGVTVEAVGDDCLVRGRVMQPAS